MAGLDFAKGEISLGRFRLRLPRQRRGRIALGSALMVGGVLGFLPILGFWMFPLGLAVLSQDVPAARRMRRKAVVKWYRARRSQSDT